MSDFVVALHDETEVPEQRLVGDDAELPADQVSGALDREQCGLGVLGEWKRRAPPGRVEVTQLGVPLPQRLPLDVAVVHRVLRGVVAEHDLGPFGKGHWEVAVVTPRRAFDQRRAEVHALAVAAVAEEVGQRAHDRRFRRLVEGDLQDDAPRVQVRILMTSGVDVADDPRPWEVCHDHSPARIQQRQFAVPVVLPARVGEADRGVLLDDRQVVPDAGGIARRLLGRQETSDRCAQKYGPVEFAVHVFTSAKCFRLVSSAASIV